MGSELVKILYQTPIVADYSFANRVGRVFVAGEVAGILPQKRSYCGKIAIGADRANFFSFTR
ncbi:hypothetical protein IQ270_05260 [Microcoleus sp. LEGE 07076]|uniref:hypothetical protein n=1 Tax=Microcoleus sp. LEGE 07076 TaxID=915322 RepID=UPI00188161AD|nr:hypothetical protein [Microcoleus sp. LEGE 07076]MBE9184142.1 hypothetical protein [Microcoleus sp. LEGE 07076]